MVNDMIQNDFEILTDRLILRAARAEDAEEITRAKQEVWDELQKWMSWAFDGEETLASTLNYIDNCAKDGGIPLVGFCRDNTHLLPEVARPPHKSDVLANPR